MPDIDMRAIIGCLTHVVVALTDFFASFIPFPHLVPPEGTAFPAPPSFEVVMFVFDLTLLVHGIIVFYSISLFDENPLGVFQMFLVDVVLSYILSFLMVWFISYPPLSPLLQRLLYAIYLVFAALQHLWAAVIIFKGIP